MSQRDIRVIVPAGGSTQVSAQGDFIYCKTAGNEIKIILNATTLVMREGDKTRIEKKHGMQAAFDSFEIQNNSATDLSVVLVVGFGDYERIVVSGELNVSSYVKTNTIGVSAGLPYLQEKTIGLVSEDQLVVARDDTKQTGQNVPNKAYDCFYFEGEFYGIDRDTLYQIDTTADNLHKATFALDWSGVALSTDVNVWACDVTKSGEVYFFSGRNFYKFQMRSKRVELLATNLATTPHYGGRIIGNYFYCVYATNAVARIDLTTIALEEIYYGAHGRACVFTLPEYPNEFLTRSSLQLASRFTLDGEFIDTINTGYYSVYGVKHSDDGALAVYSDNLRYTVRYAASQTIYGELFVEEIGDALTRKSALITTPVTYYDNPKGVTIYGGVIRHIIAAMTGKDNPNYLDYLVSFEWSSGFTTKKISSGTQSWALRNIVDEVDISTTSNFKIELLPAAFLK